MPNWVTNRMKVTGPSESVAAVKELITNNEKQADWWNGRKGPILMDFDRIVPQPPEVVSDAEEQPCGSAPLWYTWRVENWGTKWDAWEFSESLDRPTAYAVYFVTAWSRPKPIYEALAKRFKDCTFTVWYWIEGNDGGKAMWKWDSNLGCVRFDETYREDSRFCRLVEDRCL